MTYINTAHEFIQQWNMTSTCVHINKTRILIYIYTAQQKFSTDFIFVVILVRIRNDVFEVINKNGNP